jgi:hypothetical protein
MEESQSTGESKKLIQIDNSIYMNFKRMENWSVVIGITASLGGRDSGLEEDQRNFLEGDWNGL